MSQEMDGCSNTHLIMHDEISKYRDDGELGCNHVRHDARRNE